MENITLINPNTGAETLVTMPLDFDEMITYRNYIPKDMNEFFEGMDFDVNSLKESFTLDDAQFLATVIKESEIDESEPGIIDEILEAYQNFCYNIDSFEDFLEAINPRGFYINWDVDDESDYARDYIYNNMSVEDDLFDYLDLESYGNDLLDNAYNYIHFMKDGGMMEIEGWSEPGYLGDFETVSHLKKIEKFINEHGPIYVLVRNNDDIAGFVSDKETAEKVKKLSEDYYWNIKKVESMDDLKGYDYWDNKMEKKVKYFIEDNDLCD